MNAMVTDASMAAHEQSDWRCEYALRESMYAWANDINAQVDTFEKVRTELGVEDYIMARIHARRRWYLTPDTSFSSLKEYIDATRDALIADVRAYQAEVAAAEAAHRKRRREALKSAPAPMPERVRPLRASSRRTRSEF
jgi:hypothetical protein